jgi:putative aldouronate transport system permease protein
LFQSAATRADIVRVLRNTLAMSGLGILTSWVPMAFAIFLNEIKNTRFRRFVQTFTTIPNFISWVLVYAIALAIFSTDGFINSAGIAMGLITEGTNYLMGNSHIWLKMLLWGIWKGVGWSAIIYIAGISGIDQQLYEAATVDGAGRFQRMWHVTVPGLVPTYCVMLLMSIANILSNGMDQYLVFQNATNTSTIEVLDLYVYLIGIGDGNIPLSTVVGMVKSIVSVILLFVANRISKAIRGESIV